MQKVAEIVQNLPKNVKNFQICQNWSKNYPKCVYNCPKFAYKAIIAQNLPKFGQKFISPPRKVWNDAECEKERQKKIITSFRELQHDIVSVNLG